MTTIGIYAGSFDPFTNGHDSIVRSSVEIFDRVIIAVGNNATKSRLFSCEERVSFVQDYLKSPWYFGTTIEVRSFEGLLIKFCEPYADQFGDKVSIVRGLRAVSDFEAEMAIADANRRLNKRIKTVFIPTSAEDAFISSTITKELARHDETGIALLDYVLPSVSTALRTKLRGVI